MDQKRCKAGIQKQAVSTAELRLFIAILCAQTRGDRVVFSSGLFIFCYSLGGIQALILYLHLLILFCFVCCLFNIAFPTTMCKMKREKNIDLLHHRGDIYESLWKKLKILLIEHALDVNNR